MLIFQNLQKEIKKKEKRKEKKDSWYWFFKMIFFVSAYCMSKLTFLVTLYNLQLHLWKNLANTFQMLTKNMKIIPKIIADDKTSKCSIDSHSKSPFSVLVVKMHVFTNDHSQTLHKFMCNRWLSTNQSWTVMFLCYFVGTDQWMISFCH